MIKLANKIALADLMRYAAENRTPVTQDAWDISKWEGMAPQYASQYQKEVDNTLKAYPEIRNSNAMLQIARQAVKANPYNFGDTWQAKVNNSGFMKSVFKPRFGLFGKIQDSADTGTRHEEVAKLLSPLTFKGPKQGDQLPSLQQAVKQGPSAYSPVKLNVTSSK
jgi:hypothetical protein